MAAEPMPALSEPTIGLSSARALIQRFEKYDIDTQQLAARLNIARSLLEENDSRLPISVYTQLWAYAIEISQDPMLGLTLAQEEDPSSYGLVAHVVFNSPTFKVGLENYIRLFSIVNEAIDLQFEQGEESSSIRFIHKFPEFYCASDMERTLAISVGRTNKALGKRVPVHRVSFQHAAPEHAEAYRDFFQCEVLFDQPYGEILFNSSILSVKPKGGNPHLGAATLDYANRILARLFKRRISQRVRRILEQNLGDPNMDAEKTAQILNMSRQTLYRKLKNDGSSYSGLVDKVKKEKAIELMKSARMSLSVIAFELGFSELSAFTRAFKRWTGQTPAEYRKQHSIV